MHNYDSAAKLLAAYAVDQKQQSWRGPGSHAHGVDRLVEDTGTSKHMQQPVNGYVWCCTREQAGQRVSRKRPLRDGDVLLSTDRSWRDVKEAGSLSRFEEPPKSVQEGILRVMNMSNTGRMVRCGIARRSDVHAGWRPS